MGTGLHRMNCLIYIRKYLGIGWPSADLARRELKYINDCKKYAPGAKKRHMGKLPSLGHVLIYHIQPTSV